MKDIYLGKSVYLSYICAEGVGLKVGQMKLIEADMLKSELVKENIIVADVLLVNNKYSLQKVHGF